MAHTFRLLRAGGDSTIRSADLLRESSPAVTFSTDKEITVAGNYYSVLIGNNGSGKSRLLGQIASEFALRYRHPGLRSEKTAKLAVLDYLVDGSPVERNATAGTSRRSIGGPASALALPTRVIAVALTPVDKFPLEVSGTSDEVAERELADPDEDNAFYHYVGMRDRTNRASISALLYRAVEGLGLRRTTTDTARLRAVFEMLDYRPEILVRLRISISEDVQTFFQSERALNELRQDDSRLLKRLRTAWETGSYSDDWLRTKLGVIASSAEKGGVEFALSFEGGGQSAAFDIEALRLLRRLGALTLSAVIVCRTDGTRHDLRQASSGEISILTVFLSIASRLRDGSLVLIDEPETSLHPEWQSKYIHLVREVFSGFSGCHFIFSTHSPHIVADVPAGSCIYSMDRASTVSSDELLGRSPDYVMARAFDVVGPTNYYLRDVLAEALRLVGEREIGSAAFKTQLAELVRLSDHMEDGDQVKRIVEDLQSAQAELAPHAD